jgi:hypothetical protein
VDLQAIGAIGQELGDVQPAREELIFRLPDKPAIQADFRHRIQTFANELDPPAGSLPLEETAVEPIHLVHALDE